MSRTTSSVSEIETAILDWKRAPWTTAERFRQLAERHGRRAVIDAGITSGALSRMINLAEFARKLNGNELEKWQDLDLWVIAECRSLLHLGRHAEAYGIASAGLTQKQVRERVRAIVHPQKRAPRVRRRARRGQAKSK